METASSRAMGGESRELRSLGSFLASLRLSHIAGVLDDMGAFIVEDLLDLEPEDIDDLGITDLERARLEHAIRQL